MPTRYLLDTNILTALSRGEATALTHLQSLASDDEIYACFIVVGEWEYGIRNAPGQRRQDQIRAAGIPIFGALTAIWDSTPAISVQYGHLQAQLRAVGQMIPTNDLWIAATGQVNQATLVTADPHFRRLTGLTVVDWTQS